MNTQDQLRQAVTELQGQTYGIGDYMAQCGAKVGV